MTMLRPKLESLPLRLRNLPVDDRGYPVPWFVDWMIVDGVRVPEFRAMDPEKWKAAISFSLCWVCGQRLGAHKAFVIGPMCGVNRTTAEPPCHRECAEWSARNCPFMARPHAKRREDETINVAACAHAVPGIMIPRNPGVTCVWITHTFSVFNDGNGKPLISLGEPDETIWYAEGRQATRAEIMESVRTGYPLLEQAARDDPRDPDRALQELHRYLLRFEPLLPAA